MDVYKRWPARRLRGPAYDVFDVNVLWLAFCTPSNGDRR